MKKLIKSILVIMLVFIGTSKSFSQKSTSGSYDQKFKLGFGLTAGYPFSEPYDLNIGGDVRLQYDFSKVYSLTLTTGFNNLFVSGDNNDLGYIPVKAGFKAFIFEDQFYVMGEAGAAFAVTNDYNKTSLLLSPTFGYATKYIDISVRYEYLPDFPTISNNTLDKGLGQIALRLAYGFKL